MARPKERYKRRCVQCWSESNLYREATHQAIYCQKHYKRWLNKKPICKLDGCNVHIGVKPKDSRQGYCRLHDHLLLKEPHRTADAIERTRNKFASQVKGDPINGCWVWEGRLNGKEPEEGEAPKGNRYPLINVGNHEWLAHRYSFNSFIGGHRPGFTLDHVCRNAMCVRPDHLMPMTLLSNTRKERDGRQLSRDDIARVLLLIPEMPLDASAWAMLKGLPIGRAQPGEPFGFGLDGQPVYRLPGPTSYPSVVKLARA